MSAATNKMMILDTLFNIMINLPDLSNIPTCLPAIARPKNQNQEIKIVATVNPTFSYPEYSDALVPITPIVSIMACGFSNETDSAKLICFLADIAKSEPLLDDFSFHNVQAIYNRKINPTIYMINCNDG